LSIKVSAEKLHREAAAVQNGQLALDPIGEGKYGWHVNQLWGDAELGVLRLATDEQDLLVGVERNFEREAHCEDPAPFRVEGNPNILILITKVYTNRKHNITQNN
jgi:hypothetical protein